MNTNNTNICDMLFNKCITDKSSEFKILTGTYKYHSSDNTQVLNCINNLQKCYNLTTNVNFLQDIKILYSTTENNK
jgi:hypothetical protein